jgi:hypothetical protein
VYRETVCWRAVCQHIRRELFPHERGDAARRDGAYG